VYTRHELDHVRVSLSVNHLNIGRILFLKLLLQVTAPMLILAKRVDLIDQAFQLNVGKPIH
jgi:hypothetical protein